RRKFTDDEWDLIAGTMLGRMGRAGATHQGDNLLSEAPDVFSASTFIPNWNRLSPAARRQLFGGTRYAELEPELNALVRVTGALNQAERIGNPSGTARNLLVAAGLTMAGRQLITGHPLQAIGTLTAGVIA